MIEFLCNMSCPTRPLLDFSEGHKTSPNMLGKSSLVPRLFCMGRATKWRAWKILVSNSTPMQNLIIIVVKPLILLSLNSYKVIVLQIKGPHYRILFMTHTNLTFAFFPHQHWWQECNRGSAYEKGLETRVSLRKEFQAAHTNQIRNEKIMAKWKEM